MKKTLNIFLKSIFFVLVGFLFVVSYSVVYVKGEETFSLNLLGDSTLYLTEGTEYIEFGATAYDPIDGDLTSFIVIDSSNVNVNAYGTYTVKYSVQNSSNETLNSTRTVIVSSFSDQNYLDTSIYSSSSFNNWNKIIQTSDGGYLCIGSQYYYSYYRQKGYIAKYDNNMNLLWYKIQNGFNSSSNIYTFDVVENSNGDIIITSFDSSYRYTYVNAFSNNGTFLAGSYLSGNYTNIKLITDKQFALFGIGSSNNYHIATLSLNSLSFRKVDYSSSYNLSNSYFIDGKLYFIHNNYLYKINLDDFEIESSIAGNYNGLYCNEKGIYTYIGSTIYKYDFDLNLMAINEITSNISSNLYENNGYLIYKSSSNIILLDSSNLDYLNTIPLKYSISTTNSLIIDSNNQIFIVGKNDNQARHIRISYYELLSGFESMELNLNNKVDLESEIDVTGLGLASNLTWYIESIDSSEFNPNRSGVYNIYYCLKLIDHEGIKTVLTSKEITVHPKTSIEDSATYNGSLMIDVEGGDIFINGEEYKYGDEFNIPGQSTLVIMGEKGYKKTINFSVEPIISGVKDGATYYTPVMPIFSGGTITLNGEEYISETQINTKGNHQLVINGASGYKQIINFIIEPTILGVENGRIYTTSIRPLINAESMTLNDEVYNNEEITNCGYYTLVITGTGGYKKTIDFTIDTVISDLENRAIYQGNVTPSFTKGSAVLNGIVYTSGAIITTPGFNTLEISGENGYKVVYQFTVNLIVENLENAGVYNGEVTPNISGGTTTLNGEPYTIGSTIDIPGNYTLVINGAASFQRTYYFIVKPEQVNVQNNAVYNESIIPIVSKGTLLLNGEEFISGTVINASGNYELKIIGKNGYYQSIKFTLISGANVKDGEIYKNNITLQFVGTATLNGESINPNTLINKVGNYELVINDGDTILIYNFVIEPDYSVFNQYNYLNVSFELENCDLTLSGEVIEGYTSINKVGTYQLVVSGINGYSKIIIFDVLPELNVENNAKYPISKEVIIYGGRATVDGQEYIESIVISEIGSHTIEVTGENGYKLDISFDIVPNVLNIENGGVYFGGVTPIINGGTITLNGESFISETEILDVGVYTILVEGENGYELEINFIILPSNFQVKPNEFYFENIIIDYDSCDVKIDGELYISNTTYSTYGKHTLSFIYNGIESKYDFYIIPSIDNIANGASYLREVTPIINYDYLLLNNVTYTSGTPIKQIGHNILTLKDLNGFDYEIHFTIEEEFLNVEDGGVYVGSVTPEIANGTLYLNNVLYTSGTTITKVGYHTLKIVGVNGFVDEISFTVKEQISGVEHYGEYNSGITPMISNATTLLLNGSPYTSGTIIRNVGYHTITIIGVNGYESEIFFTIHEQVSGIVNYEEYASSVVVTVSYTSSIELNGQSYSSGTRIYDVGHHTLIVKGVNGYESTYYFTVNHSLSGVEDGGIYTSSYITISCNYATLSLNGNLYNSGTQIYTVGYYTLEIFGKGDYYQKINFIKDYNANIANDETYSGYVAVTISNTSGLYLNGEMFTSGTIIFTIGHHTMEITGVGGYEKFISFTVSPCWNGVSNNGSYTALAGTYLRLMNSYNNTSLDSQYYQKITLDGSDYVNNTTHKVIGNHQFVIYGINGYTHTINFKINPAISNISDNYNGYSFTPAIDLGLSRYLYTVSNDSSYPFSIADNIIKSTNHTHNSTSTYTLKALQNSTVSFSYMVISESGYDYLHIKLNGSAKISLSGIHNSYTHYTVNLSAGDILTFSYSKDGSVSNREDCIYIKDLVVTSSDYDLETSEFAYVTIDDEIYVPGTEIKEVGNHVIKIYGSNEYLLVYNITIQPRISDLMDGLSYSGQVIPRIDFCDLELNGETFISGTKIDLVGNHVIKITGSNGFEKELNFTILPLNVGNYSGKTFEKSIIVDNINNATLYLNGNLYNYEEITEIGNHTITIIGVNGYTQEFSFVIRDNPILKTEEGLVSFVNNFTVKNIVQITVPNALNLYIDNELYKSGDTYNVVGRHYLKVVGNNGYESEYTFTILDQIPGLVNGGKYDNLLITCNNVQSMVLNGNIIKNNHNVNEVGNYTLTIYGTNGYVNSYTFSINLLANNIENNAFYDTKITPTINSSRLTLNGNPYISGESIDYVGYNTLVILGEGGYRKEIPFTIEPIVSGVEEGQVYTEAKRAYILGNVQEITLNNQDYLPNQVINTIGYNILKIIGVNGYEKIVGFYIIPVITGVEEGQVYSSSLKVTVSGIAESMTLNGVEWFPSECIDTVGYNILKIYGANGYLEEIQFTILPEVTGVVNGGVYMGSQKVQIIGNTELITLNELECPSNLTISIVGYNVLKVKGVNGYEETIEFTVLPIVLGVEEGGVYQGEVTPIVSDGIDGLFFNNSLISSGTKINEIGNNQLKIIGVNGYEETISFVIEPVMINYNTGEFDASFTPSFIGKGQYLLNNELYLIGSPITTIGNNKIRIIGKNGFEKEYLIVINPILIGITNNMITNRAVSIYTQSDCLLYIDNYEYQIETAFGVIGNHTLKVEGINEYEREYSFTIQEDYDLVENKTYVGEFSLDYYGVQVLIDSVPYNSGKVYRNIGHHILTIVGANGYTNKYNFTLVPVIHGISSSNEYEGSVTFSTSNGTLYLDDVVVGDTAIINSIGNHKIIMIGSNDYRYIYSFSINPAISSITNNESYTEKVTISLKNQATKIMLNDIEITNGYICSTIGHHRLTVYGTNDYIREYNFTVEPEILNISNNVIYYYEATWIINGAGKFYINDVEVSNYGTINKVGNNILEIIGVNGYSKKINFTITPKIMSIMNGETYKKQVQINIPNSKLTLNGEILNDGPFICNTIGNNILLIEGVNGYQQILNFVIEEDQIGLTNEGVYKEVTISNIENCTVLLNNKVISSGIIIKDIGNHTLKIIGVNGYENEYKFTIMPESNIKNGDEFTAYVYAHVPYATLYLNGNIIKHNDVITNIGKNKLQIIGLNGYIEEIEFTIYPKIDIADNGIYKEKVKIKKLDARMFINDIEIFEDTYVDKDGIHSITILGSNGYQETITFTYHNPNIGYTIMFGSITLLVGIAYIILIIRRKKVI